MLTAALPRRALVIAAWSLYVGIVLWAASLEEAAPSPASEFTAIGAAVLPFAVILCLRAPTVFPLCLYVAFIPFENLFVAGSAGSVARALAIASGAVMIVRIFILKGFCTPPRTVIVWGLLILWMIASSTWAINDTVIGLLGRYLQLYLLFAIVSVMPVQWRDLRWTIVSFVFGGMCAALYGDYLLAQGTGINRGDRLFLEAGGRFVDPNEFAAALLIPFALSTVYFLRQPLVFRKLIALVPVIVVASGFFTSASRGGLIAVGVMLAYLLLFSRYRAQLGLLLAAVGVALLASPLMARFAVALSSGGNGRVSIWRTGLEAFRRNNWLLGTGVGSFPDAYDRVWLEVNHGRFHHWHIVAHNLIAQTGVELGIVGLVLLLGGWWAQVLSLRKVSGDELFIDLRFAAESSIIAFFVAAMFVDLLKDKSLWASFMLSSMVLQYARSRELSRGEMAEQASCLGFFSTASPASPATATVHVAAREWHEDHIRNDGKP